MPPSVIAQLADIPDEEIWLAGQKSACARQAYRLDVRYCMTMLGITTTDEPHQVDNRAAIARERAMRGGNRPVEPSTFHRRLSAPFSLFTFCVHGCGLRAGLSFERLFEEQPQASDSET